MSNLISARKRQIELATAKSMITPRPFFTFPSLLARPNKMGPGMNPRIKRMLFVN